MHYTTNVSKNGFHVFTTSKNSAVSEPTAKKLYNLIKEKFPESEGYQVDASQWSTTGKDVTF